MAPKGETGNATAFLTPYRAAGFVTDGTPPVLQRRGAENFVTTSVGCTFQIFNCANLRLRFVGAQLPGAISALEVRGDRTFAAVGAEVHVVHRAEHVGVLRGHTRPVRLLAWVGELLVSVCAGGVLNAWQTASPDAYEDSAPVVTVELQDMEPSALLHPATYLNKLLVGSEGGPLELWNVRTRKRVHRFLGWGSAVTTLAQSTAVDVAAVGLRSGDVHVHNLRDDVTLFTFRMGEGAVAAVDFRTDGTPVLASASDLGHIALWDLSRRQLAAQIEFAHDGEVRAAKFLAGEPVLVTTGADNALKMWLFDQPGGGARLLRSRSGHSSPPVRVRFYSDAVTSAGIGAGGASDLLSAAPDRAVRRTSLWLQQQDSELTQGHVVAKARRLGHSIRPVSLKLPTVVAFDVATLREREWANMVSCHAGSAEVATWSTARRAQGKLVLASPLGEAGGEATAVCVSRCGNFAYVGTSAGRIDKYNLQSGLHRGTFGDAAVAADQSKNLLQLVDAGLALDAHRGAVRGLAIDGSQRLLVSGGHDGTVRLWNVHTRAAAACMHAHAAVAHLCSSNDTALAAVACDDLRVRVFDVRARLLVREFAGHTRAITDLSFTPDGRRLLTASLDSTLRLVDLPSARLVGWHSLRQAATSIAWSPGGEFLATTHAGCVALCVWANRALFSDLVLDAEVTRPTPLDLPASVAGDEEDEEEVAFASVGGENPMAGGAPRRAAPDANSAIHRSLAATAMRVAAEEESRDALRAAARPEQLAHNLATLSGLPATVWKSLHTLDEMRERNKPRAPPEAPPQVPFFLSTRPGLEPEFVAPPAAKGASGERDASLGVDMRERVGSKIVTPFTAGADTLMEDTPLLRHVRSGAEQGSYDNAAEYLKTLGPVAMDVQLRALAGGDASGLGDMLNFFLVQVEARVDFDLTQALLAHFLKLHSDELQADAGLRLACQRLAEVQERAWSGLEDAFHDTLCMVNFLSHQQA